MNVSDQSATQSQWIWSAEHGDYYFNVFENGNWVYHWAQQYQASSAEGSHQGQTQQHQTASQQPQHQLEPRYQPLDPSTQSQQQYNAGTHVQGSQQHSQQHPYAVTRTEQRPYVPTIQGYQTGSGQPGYAYTPQVSLAEQQDRPFEQATTGYASTGPSQEPQSAIAPFHERISGTPGMHEALDASYYVRTGAEAARLFQVGTVFATLHSQAASADALQGWGGSNMSTVRYGERVFSQIRRFVIVSVRPGFVYGCPISTYQNRGTLKPGCAPQEHCIAYLQGRHPQRLQGEAVLRRRPMMIVPVDRTIQVHPASRLHLARQYLIEKNVKVKEIGYIAPEDLSDLLRYYQEEHMR